MSRRLYVFLVAMVIVAIGGALVLGLRGHGSADVCKATKVIHKVVIARDHVTPSGTIRASLCDRLEITNQDAEAREIAFGPHERHVPYDGVAERVLNKGQSLTITLNKSGTYHWHDHEHDEVEGYFKVTN